MKSNKTFLIVLTIIVVIIGYALYIILKSNDEPVVSNYSHKQEIINQTNIQSVSLTYSAWIPSWSSIDGFQSLQNNKDLFNSISPVWYEANDDGSLYKRFPSNFTAIKTFCKENNILLIPTIAMFNHELFSRFAQDPEKLDRHIAAILEEVETNNYDGIDIDYESTKFIDKDHFFKIIKDLSKAFRKEDKILSITVLPKWGDNIDYPSLPETRRVQDWGEISQYADEIRIMAYDYTYSKAALPGPIAPIEWVNDILDYAENKVAFDKLVLGIHLYSYEWYTDSSASESLEFETDFFKNSTEGNITARSYDYSVVKEVLQKYEGKKFKFQEENVYIYSTHENHIKEDRVLIYTDPEGVKARVDLAEEYGLRGVVFWRIGGEEDLISDLK